MKKSIILLTAWLLAEAAFSQTALPRHSLMVVGDYAFFEKYDTIAFAGFNKAHLDTIFLFKNDLLINPEDIQPSTYETINVGWKLVLFAWLESKKSFMLANLKHKEENGRFLRFYEINGN